MTGSDIGAAIGNEMGVLFTVDEQRDYYRIRTPYLYPDGDNIDLFCEWNGDTITVSDLAETTGWLRMQSIAAHRSPNQNRLIADACITHNVEFYRGMLQARWRPGDDLAGVCNRVAQAALRVSDLWFTLRYRAGSATLSVVSEVEEYLAERRLDYERARKLAGRSQQVWNVDLYVRAPRAPLAGLCAGYGQPRRRQPDYRPRGSRLARLESLRRRAGRFAVRIPF